MNLLNITNITILSSLIAVLATIAAASGFFSKDAGTPFTFVTLRGQSVQIFGRGLYRFDTVFLGAAYKGQDAVALFLSVLLLIISIALYQRGLMSGQLFLVGTLGYFLYLSSSMALNSAYNRLLLLYIVLFSASLYAYIQVFSLTYLNLMTAFLPDDLPRRSLVIFMIVTGVVILVVWGASLFAAHIMGIAQERMDSYTTMMTYA